MRVLLSYVIPDSVRHVFHFSIPKSSNNYSADAAWPRVASYDEIHSTLTGEGTESLHNNTIALALRNDEEIMAQKRVSILKDIETQGWHKQTPRSVEGQAI